MLIKQAYDLLAGYRHVCRRGFYSAAKTGALLLVALMVLAPATSLAQTRSLKLYFLHTGERDNITYMRNGKYVQAGLNRVNHFLRDWRRNEPTKMDPQLLDLLWEVYRESGSKDYIHVISAYRSPATNDMLRRRGRGVARKSQHTLGKAIDFFLPDVKLSKLRRIGLIEQAGGVGYYPRSGSPFIHLDTGNVRHWPRMSRRELARVFPDGKTLHVPADGKPMPGYKVALAAYNARVASGRRIQVEDENQGGGLNFFQRLARAGRDEEEDAVANVTPAPRPVRTTGQPAEPETEAPAAQIELANVPVPTVAPRGDRPGVAPAAETAVAQAEPGPIEQPEPTDEAVAVAATPVRRPVIDSDPRPAEPPATTQLAASPPAADRGTIELAANTTQSPRAGLNDQARRPLLSAPRPAADIPGGDLTAGTPPPADTDATQTAAIEVDSLPRPSDAAPAEPVDQAPPTTTESADPAVEPIETSTEPVETAVEPTEPAVEPQSSPTLVAALPEDEPPSAEEPEFAVAIPSPRPELIDADSPIARNVRFALALVEDSAADDLASVDDLPEMMRRQQAELTASALAAGEVEEEPAQIVAVVPTPAPRFEPQPPILAGASQIPAGSDQAEDEIVTAALEPLPEQPANETQPLGRGPAPLDDLSVDWFNNSLVGKWVLSASAGIDRVDDLRAPAYGRAAIRKSPDTVFTAGFEPAAGVQSAGEFAGKAVAFLDFARFE